MRKLDISKVKLRTFARIYTSRANSHAIHESVGRVIKRPTIEQVVIATALPRFNDLGRSVTPTFLSRNRLHLELSLPC